MMKRGLLLFTELSKEGSGGIEIFGTFLLKEIVSQERDTIFDVVVLNNESYDDVDERVSMCFCGGSKVKFIFHLFKALLRFPQYIISGHVGLLKPYSLLHAVFRRRYGVVVYGIEVWKLDWITKVVLRQARCIASFSRYTTEKMLDLIDVQDQIIAFPPPMKKDKFFPKEKSTALVFRYDLEDKKTLLTVARLSKDEQYKGYDQIIRALPEIIKFVPKIKYLIVGPDGGDRKRIEMLVQELSLEDHVELCGFVHNDEMIDYYNTADLFVMPSKGEGFGIVFIESIACGTPVLAGNKDGSQDAVLDGEVGILVDPDDVDEIAERVIEFFKGNASPHLYDKELLIERADRSYSMESFQERVKKLLLKVNG